MATITNKILGQHQITTTSFEDLYIVPPLTTALVTVVATDVSGTGNQQITLHIAASSPNLVQENIYKTVPLAENGPTLLLSGLCLGPGYTLRVRSSISTNGAVFTAYGQELT